MPQRKRYVQRIRAHNEMIKKRICIGLFMVISLQFAFSQINTRIDQYYLDFSILNPSAINTTGSSQIGVFYNQLFRGIPGNPENLLISATFPNSEKGAGFGINLGQEKIGFSILNQLYASYAYTIKLKGNAGKLHTGLSIGILSQRFNPDAIDVIDPNDVIVQSLQQGTPDNRIDARVGFTYQNGGLMIGGSSGRVTRPKFEYEYLNRSYSFQSSNLTNLNAQVKLQFSEKFVLQPSLSLSIFDFKEKLIMFGANAIYNKKFWIGAQSAGYNNIAFNFGFLVKDIVKFGYSYSMPYGSDHKVLKSGHEVYTGFVLGRTKDLVKKLPEDNFVIGRKRNSDSTGIAASADRDMGKVSEITMKNDTIVIGALEEMKFLKTGYDTSKIQFKEIPKDYPADGYYVTIGVFKYEGNANRFIKIMYTKGITAYKIYLPDNEHYYVYIFRGDTPDEADEVKWQDDLNIPDIWTKKIFRKRE